jgi:hypothetical protein
VHTPVGAFTTYGKRSRMINTHVEQLFNLFPVTTKITTFKNETGVYKSQVPGKPYD